MRTLAAVTALSLFLAGPATAEESIFKDPVRLKSDGDYIRVESPGYAFPCLADITGDGKKDLLVGQFKSGKIKVFENLGKNKWDVGTWLSAEGKVAEVPGVW